MDNLLILLVYGFAVWRISFILVYEEGLFQVAERIRRFIGIRLWWELDVNEQEIWINSNPTITDIPESIGFNTFAKMLLCLGCTSVTVGAIITVLHLVNPTVTLYLTAPFALSTIAVVIENKRQ